MKPPNTCAKTTRQLLARIYEKHLNYSQTDTIMYHLSRWMDHWDEATVQWGPQETCSLEWEVWSAERSWAQSRATCPAHQGPEPSWLCVLFTSLHPGDKTLTKQTNLHDNS